MSHNSGVRLLLAAGLISAGVLAVVPQASASSGPSSSGTSGTHSSHVTAPDRIPLPNGFSPEDITDGRGSTFYVGSLATGAIVKGDFRTGAVAELVAGGTAPTVGIYLERRGRGHDRLWAAGGPTGAARVYDAATGTLLRSFQLESPSAGGFVNDVIVTEHAAYYTDSFLPQLFVLPLGEDGALPMAAKTVPLSGDVVYGTTPNAFNLNGLAAFDGLLVSGQTNTGKLFTINPRTGVTRQLPLVDAAGKAVTVFGADGIAQHGSTLYIAQNFPNTIAIVTVSEHARKARLRASLTSPALDIPSSTEASGGFVYGLNARFTTPATATTTYDIVKVAMAHGRDGGKG